MPTEKEGGYKVGYGRPLESSRFAKGQSGNPKGRPKGSKNLSTLLDDALNESVVVSEHGKRKRITKRVAVLKHLVNKAASGNHRAIQLLLSEMRWVEGREQDSTPGQLFDEADREVIRQLYERFRSNGHEEKKEK